MLTISLAVSGIVAGGGEEIAPPPENKISFTCWTIFFQIYKILG